MEVTHYAEDFAHVVLGGEKARGFGITDDASFYTILSDTLYTDKKRACVREVICNAWDAHIASGRTDQSIVVEITDTYFAVRDFGFGIAHEQIGPIYCVYGKSTKDKDENQTGGFGLGCKAPFAITSNFTVESHHKNQLSVYAISRGSDETDGKPDYRRVANASSDQSGIRVIVPIEPNMRQEMTLLAREIASDGGILATVNGTPVEQNDWTAAEKQGYALIAKPTGATAYVRYGTVLYPLTTTDADVTSVLRSFAALRGSGLSVVLMARPGSVAIAPSREALSMTDRTKTVVLRLARKATHGILEAQRLAAKARLKKEAKALSKNNRLFDTHDTAFSTMSPRARDLYVDPMDIGLAALPQDIGGRFHNRLMMLWRARASQAPDMRRTMRRLAGACAKSYHWNVQVVAAQIRHDLRLYTRVAVATNLLSQSYIVRTRYGGVSPEFIKLAKARPNNALACRIFVGYSQREVKAEIIACRKEDRSWERETVFAIVLKPHQSQQIAKIKAVADRLKIHVHVVDRIKPEPVSARVKSEKVYHSFHETSSIYHFDAPASLTNPTSYLRSTYFNAGRAAIDPKHLKVREAIGRHFSNVALVHNDRDENVANKAGIVPLEQLVCERIQAMKHRKAFIFAYNMAARRAITAVTRESTASMLIEAASNYPEAAVVAAGGRMRLTQELRETFDLARIFVATYASMTSTHRAFKLVSDLRKELNAAPFERISGMELVARYGPQAPFFFSTYHTFESQADVDRFLALLPALERFERAHSISSITKDAA